MSLIAPAWWRRAARGAANLFPPATGDGGSIVAPGTFPNAPSGGGWTNLFEQDFAGLPRRQAYPYVDADTGQDTLVVTQDMYLGQDPYLYCTYTGGVATPWSASGAYLSIRFPPNHPGGYTTVKVQPNGAGRAPLGLNPTLCPTGELYYAWYMRFRGSGGNPYTTSGNQQKLLYFGSTDAGSNAVHAVIGAGRTGVTDLSLLTQFNPPSDGLFNTIWQGTSAAMDDGQWHLVELRLKRNTYTAGSGTVQVTGTTATFSASQTGLTGKYLIANAQTFRVVSGSGTTWTVEPTASSATGSVSFSIANVDGEVQLWLDGTQKLSRTDIPLFVHTGGDNAVPDFWSFEPIYGGGFNPSPNWSLYVDMGRLKAVGR